MPTSSGGLARLNVSRVRTRTHARMHADLKAIQLTWRFKYTRVRVSITRLEESTSSPRVRGRTRSQPETSRADTISNSIKAWLQFIVHGSNLSGMTLCRSRNTRFRTGWNRVCRIRFLTAGKTALFPSYIIRAYRRNVTVWLRHPRASTGMILKKKS